jgi:glycosyltransferase EpsF
MTKKNELNEVPRVLHIVRSLKAGGIGAFIMNMYRKVDKDQIQFDFAVTEEDKGVFGEEILRMGGRIHYISQNGNNNVLDGITQLFNLYRILKKEESYVAVHSHYYFANASFLFISKLAGIQNRISHSHNTRYKKIKNPFRIFFEFISQMLLKYTATSLVGCSNAAVEFLYGRRNIESGLTTTIYNGIDFELWNVENYDQDIMRKKYNIQKGLNFVFVGRFEEQKNPIFLINVFSEVYKKFPNSQLTVIGYGSLENSIKKEVQRLGLVDNISFLASDSNVPEILSCMEYMLLPSLFEGLGIVLLEAQAMGVECFVSNNVTKEVNMGLCTFIPINQGTEIWLDVITDSIKHKTEKQKNALNRNDIEKFDVNITLRKMLNLYLDKDQKNA